MLSENQILKKKPAKLSAPKAGDVLTAINRSFLDGYEKALFDLNNDHVITYETARNYMEKARERSKNV